MFTSMLSGLAHDMRHKGVNNMFNIKKKSENSLRYVETAVNENMHTSTYFRLLNQYPEIDITKKMDA